MRPRPLARGWRDPSRQIRSRSWRKHDDTARPLCDLARYGSLDRARRRLGDRVPAGLDQMMIPCPVATSADLIGSAAGPAPSHLDEESHRATGVIEFLPLRDLGTLHMLRVLQHTRGKIRPAAHILGITRWSLARRLRKDTIPPPTTESDEEIATLNGLLPLHDLATQHIGRVVQHTHGKSRPAASTLGAARGSSAPPRRQRSPRACATA